MKADSIQHTLRAWLGCLYIAIISFSFPALGHAASGNFSTPNLRQPVATTKIAEPVHQDYFISSDTVIIGCTSGMAAGILVGSVPVAGAVISGIGVSESITLLVNLTGMGCGVGAVSSAVAIFTAWMLAPN